MPFAQSDGARIYWRLDGRPDRPPLVMVSSLGSDHGMWNPVLAGLEREFHVLRIDKRWLHDRPLLRADLEAEPEDMLGLGIQLKLAID